MSKYKGAKETLEKYDYSTKLELSEGIRNNITSGITVEQFFMMKETCIELLDKATPMKPLYKIPEQKRRKDGEELAHCPVCEWQLNWKYGCQNNKCRQCIDWSDEE